METVQFDHEQLDAVFMWCFTGSSCTALSVRGVDNISDYWQWTSSGEALICNPLLNTPQPLQAALDDTLIYSGMFEQ